MGYFKTFKNSTFTDILEILNLVNFEEELPQAISKQIPSSQQTSSVDTEKQDNDNQAGDVQNEDTIDVKRTNEDVPEGDDTVIQSLTTEEDVRSSPEREGGDVLQRQKTREEEEEEEDEEIAEAFREYTRDGDDSDELRKSISKDGDPYLVEFNGPDDPEHPYNWPNSKKIIVTSAIMILTFVMNIGPSVYTPGQLELQADFNVGHVVATLNLSLFLLGCGVGPMLIAPFSEVPTLGRVYMYIGPLFFFTLFQIGCATVNNIGGLVVIRFISGFLSAPVLSIGAATVGDYFRPHVLPLFVGMWAIGAVAAPALGPILGAAMVVAVDWRWIFWFYTFLSAFILVILFFFLPESLPSNILVRRARRLRKQTGDNRYYTLEEKETGKVPLGVRIKEICLRPFLLIIDEPGVLALDFYISLAYGAFFLFFECFPIVFAGIYNFTIVEQSVAFFGFLIGGVLAYLTLIVFMFVIVRPRAMAKKMTPETFLILAGWVCGLLPFSEFLFGWTAQVHWILPIIWEAFYIIGNYNIFQSSFAYLAMNYPRYRASVFAGNAFMRCTFACIFPLFGSAMYNNLSTPRFPIAWGCTILGFFTLVMCIIPLGLIKYGPKLRGRSKYAN